MTFFFERYIRPFLSMYSDVRLLEIGASEGSHSDKLLSIPGASLTIIDPCLDKPLDEIYASNSRVSVIKDISLNALPKVDGPFDGILIDGDHNWHTVLNELELIETGKLLARDGVLFFHDVGWPYGRRDMYYRPELIPEDHRQPYAAMGIVKGESGLSDQSSFGLAFYNAQTEGGEKNGVLTAIEDFVKFSKTPYALHTVCEEYGLAVLVRQEDAAAMGALNLLIAASQSLLRRAALRRRFPTLFSTLSWLRSKGQVKGGG